MRGSVTPSDGFVCPARGCISLRAAQSIVEKRGAIEYDPPRGPRSSECETIGSPSIAKWGSAVRGSTRPGRYGIRSETSEGVLWRGGVQKLPLAGRERGHPSSPAPATPSRFTWTCPSTP